MKQVETFKRSPSDMSKKSKNIRHDELIDHSIGKSEPSIRHLQDLACVEQTILH